MIFCQELLTDPFFRLSAGFPGEDRLFPDAGLQPLAVGFHGVIKFIGQHRVGVRALGDIQAEALQGGEKFQGVGLRHEAAFPNVRVGEGGGVGDL